jgi:hypothetical protein
MLAGVWAMWLLFEWRGVAGNPSRVLWRLAQDDVLTDTAEIQVLYSSDEWRTAYHYVETNWKFVTLKEGGVAKGMEISSPVPEEMVKSVESCAVLYRWQRGADRRLGTCSLRG